MKKTNNIARLIAVWVISLMLLSSLFAVPALAADTVHVTNFTELKAALQSETDIKVIVDSLEVNERGYHPLHCGTDYFKGQAAIYIPAGVKKELVLNTDVECRITGDVDLLYTFIQNSGDLTVRGTGSLRVSFNASLYPNAIILNYGSLTVDGPITFDATQKVFSETYGYCIYNLGAMDIRGGTYIGYKGIVAGGACAAVMHDNGAKPSVISGGTFKSVKQDLEDDSAEEGIHVFGLNVDSDFKTDTLNLTVSGGTFEGIRTSQFDNRVKLPDLLPEGYEYRRDGKTFDAHGRFDTENVLSVAKTGAAAETEKPTEKPTAKPTEEPTEEPSQEKVYSVVFKTSGGSSVPTQEVKENETATKPADPQKEGYTFKGWYTNQSLTKKFNFSTKIQADTTLYAKWEKIEPIVTDAPGVTWADASDWAVGELEKANDAGLIPEIFDREDLTRNITRKEFAYVAVRMYEAITGKKAKLDKDGGYQNPFVDTKDQTVEIAYQLGITNGTSATTFDPDTLITREQMATMMARALTKAGIDTSVDLNKVKKFADDAQMHDWGKNAIYYMSGIGIIKGVGDNRFDVTGNATREQALLISERSVERFKP